MTHTRVAGWFDLRGGAHHAAGPRPAVAWGWRAPFAVGALMAFYTSGAAGEPRKPRRSGSSEAAARCRGESAACGVRASSASLRAGVGVGVEHARRCDGLCLDALLADLCARHSRPHTRGGRGGQRHLAGRARNLYFPRGQAQRSHRASPLLLGYAAGFALVTWSLLHFLSSSFTSMLLTEVVGRCCSAAGWDSACGHTRAVPGRGAGNRHRVPILTGDRHLRRHRALVGHLAARAQRRPVLTYYIVSLAMISVALFARMRETHPRALE